MQIICLLLLLKMFASSASSDGFATFMPQKRGTVHFSFNDIIPYDSAKNKRKTMIIIKRIDENGNEKEVIHEFHDMVLSPDSLRKNFSDRFDFDHLHKLPHLDSTYKELRIKLQKLGQSLATDTIFKLGWKNKPLMQMNMEDIKSRIRDFNNNTRWERIFPNNIEILDLSNKEASAYKTANNLQLNHFAYYPNPNKGLLTLEFTLRNKKPINVKIYDLLGRTWYDETINYFDGSYQKNIPVNMSRGIYILRIEQEKNIASKKIVVE